MKEFKEDFLLWHGFRVPYHLSQYGQLLSDYVKRRDSSLMLTCGGCPLTTCKDCILSAGIVDDFWERMDRFIGSKFFLAYMML